MDGDFRIEQLHVPAGEGTGTVEADIHFLSMAGGPATFVAWSADGGYKRRRKHVFAGDMATSGFGRLVRAGGCAKNPTRPVSICRSPQRGFRG